MKPTTIRSADLPTHEPFGATASAAKPRKGSLTTVQKLVQDNLRNVVRPVLRRRDTVEVSRALLEAPVEIGAQVWVPDAQNVWQIVTVVAHDQMTLTVQTHAKETLTVDLRHLGDVHKVNPRTVDDMTSLYYIHEAGILDNLRLRAAVDNMRPYTYMANVLIATNPLCRLVEPKIQDYIKTQMGDKPPHPYAIAEVAFQQMALRTPSQCQSIVISGESGAGKTETSKIVLRYLTSREHVLGSTKSKKPATAAEWDGSASVLDQRLLDTNPILEAFGNAKTLRNHNSSRFGKFMKLQFSDDGKHTLYGAFIETYLLEKSRLVYQIPGERNFHIFYYLLAGASPEQQQQLLLKTPDCYTYLNQSGCTTDVNVDDELLYDEVVTAFLSVGIDAERQASLFRVLSALLYVGNIALEQRETEEGQVAAIAEVAALETAASLLGVSSAAFQHVICKREISTRGEKFTIARNAKEGKYVRDAIAKSVYQHLFVWIVDTINKALGHGPPSLPFIGVLDIFGFESFKYNDFEQLLINYANEALQATFNQQVFIAEQELFTKEGIDVGTIAWPDNRECIELISAKPNGLLALLDTEAKTPQPSDEKWNANLHKLHQGTPHFLTPHKKDTKFEFIIKHFATKVSYTIGNFIDKNNDTIPKDLADFVMSSNVALITDMFNVSDELRVAKATGSHKKLSVSGKFTVQMKSLINTLDATRCNFIRCVKPNPTMTHGVFDNGYVVDQLRCTGMLATCELLKVGLPTRVSYAEICAIYKPVLPDSVTPMFQPYNDRTFTEAVLWSFRVDPQAYRLGRTRVFFKTGKIALLDALLKVDMKKMGPWIVARLKKWLARRRWRYAVAKVMGQRAFLWLYDLIQRKKRAILTIQSVIRMANVRKRFLVKRTAHRRQLKQAALVRKRWRRAIFAIRASNAWNGIWRTTQAKFEAERLRLEQERAVQLAALALQRASAVRIQTMIRGKQGRRKAEVAKIRFQEAKLRTRLAQEKAQAEELRSLYIRRKWRSALHAISAQKVFLDRFQRIHNAHVMAADAKRNAALAAEAQVRRLEEEARRAAEEAQRLAEEEAALIASREAAAAVRIQSSYRGFTGRILAKRQAAIVTASAAAAAAALAAQEAEAAATAATMAQQAEAASMWNSVPEPSMAGQAATLGTADPLLSMGSAAIAGELMERQESLGEADLSWMASNEEKVEGVAGTAVGKSDELAQAGIDLFGEGGDAQTGPLMEAEEENMVNPVARMQEFPIGPPIPYKGGIFTCTMLGHRKQQDENWGDEYTEYVMRCTWGREVLEQSKTAWLVGGRYNDFNALHQELKTAASGKRGKRAPWFPRFPKRRPFASMIGKNQQEKFIQKREKELNRYMSQVLTQMPGALTNIHMDRFMNLTLRTQDICEREAYAEARKRWEDEEREAMANAADAEPLSDDELHEVEQLVQQLLEKIIYAEGDVRHDTQLQEMIHAVKVLQPRVGASAQIGAGVDMELVPLAMQLQDDIADAFNQYNDSLLALRLGSELNASTI